MSAIKLIGGALTDLAAGPLLELALLLGAAGTLTMAILQVIKELTPLRSMYHHRWLRRWISKHGGDEALLVELADLAAGGETALFDLSAEQLVAQIHAAGQVVLDYPDRYLELLKVMAYGTEVDGLASLRAQTAGGGLSDSERAILVEARGRIATRMQRNLDGLQIAMSGRWRWIMQMGSVVLTVVLVEAAVFLVAAPGADDIFLTAFFAMLIGIAGGYLAPVTRDLVAALQSLRK